MTFDKKLSRESWYQKRLYLNSTLSNIFPNCIRPEGGRSDGPGITQAGLGGLHSKTEQSLCVLGQAIYLSY